MIDRIARTVFHVALIALAASALSVASSLYATASADTRVQDRYNSMHLVCTTLARFATNVVKDRDNGVPQERLVSLVDAYEEQGRFGPATASAFRQVIRIVYTRPHGPAEAEAVLIYRECINSAVETSYSF